MNSSNAISIEETTAPPEICEIRQRLGMDFGKLDYVLRDGKVVLFDVNRTPATAILTASRTSEKAVRKLAEVIRSVIG